MPENKLEELPFLSNAGFLLTLKCTVECPHCIVKAGPRRREEMPVDLACKWLDQISTFRDGHVCGISLTGGEPFYNLPHLITIADYAHKLGFIVSVVSNGYWATSKEEALLILSMCSSIQMVSVSADIPHQKLIPLSNVKNAIWASKKLGKLYNIAVATKNLNDPEFLSLMDELLEITDKEFISTAIILPIGRADTVSDSDNYILSSEPPQTACSMASFPVIMPNGNVFACVGPPLTMPRYNPLYLGNILNESINEIFESAEHNFVLHAIRTFGPKVLVDLLRANGYGDVLPDHYISEAICDVCYKIFYNESVCNLIKELISKDEKFRMKTAYGRYYYLNEGEMVRQDA
jgi:MoaA/NifB/PqqE/SkfB family radical SAM enzyme